MHLSMVNVHVRTIFELQTLKGGRPGWLAARETSGAARAASQAILTGVSSFAFQGTNAHALVQEPSATAAVTSSKLTTWNRQRVWIAPPSNAMLQRLLSSSGRGSRSQQATFEGSLLSPRLAFLGECALKGIALLPAAAFLETVSAAAGLLLNSTSMEGVALSTAVFATPMMLRDAGKGGGGAIGCTVNLSSGTVEVASMQQQTQQQIGAVEAPRRAHFYATLTKAHDLGENMASLQPARSFLLPVRAAAVSAGEASTTKKKQKQPAIASILANVASPFESSSFNLHPAVIEATVHVCAAHPATQRAGLRVAAKMEVASLSALPSTDQHSWTVGSPGQAGKFNAHKLLPSYTNNNTSVDTTSPTSVLEGVEMRRLITERPAMLQPKYVKYITLISSLFTQ